MSRWGGAKGGEKERMIILVLQYWTSFNPHHVLMSLRWRRAPQLPPTHTLWRQTGTRADAAPMKTDLRGLDAPRQGCGRWCAACGLSITQGRHVFPRLRYIQAFLFPLLDSAHQQMWPCINNLCLNRLWFLRAPYRSSALRPSSWTDRPLLGWRSPRNTTTWGGYDALPLRCRKAWRSAFSPSALIPVPIFQQHY